MLHSGSFSLVGANVFLAAQVQYELLYFRYNGNSQSVDPALTYRLNGHTVCPGESLLVRTILAYVLYAYVLYSMLSQQILHVTQPWKNTLLPFVLYPAQPGLPKPPSQEIREVSEAHREQQGQSYTPLPADK